MRSSALPAHLDGLRLRAELAAATRSGWATSSSRKAGLARLKKYISKGHEEALTRLEGKEGGLEAARLLAHVMNAVLHSLYDSIAMEVWDEGARKPGLALCALGGYGAGELAPQSDVDLVFILGEDPPAEYQLVIERVLYALWDAGVHVGGGALRTVDEALKLAQEDVSERTALLDLRHITGDRGLVADLLDRFHLQVREGDMSSFIEAKLGEREARIDKQGDSRYDVEPHIKDGKGGLRDLQTLRWLAQVLYGDDALERWVGTGFLSVMDVKRYLSAADFLWTTRFYLHDLHGRKDDRLTFDVQPEIAERMGYKDGDDVAAVENFMRDYFTAAIDVGALTRLVCAKLEADELKDPPSGIGRFMPIGGESTKTDDLGLDAFKIQTGRLTFSDPAVIEDDPVLMLKLFQVASTHQLDLHPDAVSLISQSLRFVDETYRSHPRAVRSFFAILLDAPDLYMTLRAMTEAGLLGAFVPEFGDIVARTQFNMYHRYTVDEHTLKALGLLREIEQGRHQQDHPLATKIAPLVNHRRALHLAVLLHDTGKGQGDQCVEGAERAQIACERLGLDEGETALVSWLIFNHLEMSDTAQRRDLSDPRTVLDFADLVGTLERLRLLTILTVVDIRAVGPGVWNGWKAQLMRDLYQAAASVLKAGRHADEEEARARLTARADLARQAVQEHFERIDPEFAKDWAQSLDDAYWLAFFEMDRLRHATFVRAARERGEDVAAGVRIDRRRSAAEVMIWAPDRQGLFADIAGALALSGANVVGAQVATTQDGHAFDVFFVQDIAGRPFGHDDPRARERLQKAVVLAACEGLQDNVTMPKLTVKRREAAFEVKPSVFMDVEAAESALVIEATCRDRPGLLHDLARVIADEGLSLQAARIDGYGERAVDVFYVTENGQKITDEARLETIRSHLMGLLEAPEESLDQQSEERGLSRARASEWR